MSRLGSSAPWARYRGATAWLPNHDLAAASVLAAGDAGSEPPGRAVDSQPVGAEAVDAGVVDAGVVDAGASGSSIRSGQPVVAADAVPAGRIPFDLSADAVLCYTVISGDALEELGTAGSVRPVPVRSGGGQAMDDSFAAAYDWMRWQMHRHIPDYAGGFPLWVWARTSRRDLVSTADDMAAQSPGSALVTLRIPREQLLIADYLTWHDVLMGSPPSPSNVSAAGPGTVMTACYDRWFDDWYDRWNAQVPQDEVGAQLPWWCWPPHLQTRLFESWEAIRSLQRGSPVQGCVEHIREAWVLALSPLRVTSSRKAAISRAQSNRGARDG